MSAETGGYARGRHATVTILERPSGGADIVVWAGFPGRIILRRWLRAAGQMMDVGFPAAHEATRVGGGYEWIWFRLST